MALNNPYANHSTHANEFKLTDNIRRSTSISPPFDETFDDNFHLSNLHIATNNHNNIQLNLTDNNYFSPISSDIQSSLVNPDTAKLNQLEYNGSFVSHIPMMSSSSSNSSLPQQQQQSNLQENLDDPRTRPIVTGRETLIEIDREQAGLGLSVVGGSDTQLINRNDKILIRN